MDEWKKLETEHEELLGGVMALYGELFILDVEHDIYTIYKMDNIRTQLKAGKEKIAAGCPPHDAPGGVSPV